ncbi:MAG: hypothetical protein JO234_00190, partial [Hyphomicrobiales bacterium]|nr:hypothetical protein [Hyphomicrobiales bacterium]
MQDSSALLAWALALLVGAAGVGLTVNSDAARSASDPVADRALDAASQLTLPEDALTGGAVPHNWRVAAKPAEPPPPSEEPGQVGSLDEGTANAAAEPPPPDPAAERLRVAMRDAPPAKLNRAAEGIKPFGALSALEAAVAPPSGGPPRGASAYGELEPDLLAAPKRLTILQLGDSHTAADFFTGRVRERLQQVFGQGGLAYIVPGKPNIGVRSALFDSDASEEWSYEALQRSDDHRRFFLSGFNAVAHHAGAVLNMRERGGGAPYDRLEVAFLKQPGGGRAEVLVDGQPDGEINLDGAADERATLDVLPPEIGRHGFHEVAVRSMTDAPVTVTGVEVARDGDGVSYISLGFPGATVQVLQKLTNENLADDLKRMAPDIIVLAFGTNEGFNDALDISAYTAQYEEIVRRLQALRPGLRIVMIGPPDGARPAGVCHNSAVGHDCPAAPLPVAADGGGPCRFPTPPKLPQVRDAQRRLAERLGVEFWDWSSVMPGPCGA